MPISKERTNINVQAERTVLAAVRLPDSTYDRTDPFGELRSLAEQAGAIVVGELSQSLERPTAATFMGKVRWRNSRISARHWMRARSSSTTTSPKQIANIEEVTGRKVLDRSELILDIFASRATTHEAKLQVELAQLEYTYPRLKAMWDHLERIVGHGGIGGIGTRGPGEQQLEIDRRLAQAQAARPSSRLHEIQARKQREVRDRKVDYFTVGLVGYTERRQIHALQRPHRGRRLRR
jgi:GTP-binding protein HflX